MITMLLFCSSLLTFNPHPNDSLTWEAKADTVLKYAYSQVGVPYQWAACAPGKCFDCSGFTMYCYNQVGVRTLRSSSGLASMGYEVPLEACRKGDMILFTGTSPGSKAVGHVGIITKNQNGVIKFIHASSSSAHYGVVETDYYNSGYPKRFVAVKRVFD